MSSYTRLLVHIVFATKGRVPVLAAAHRRELFAYIHGIARNHDATLVRINGIEDHLHILVALHPATPVSEFVKLVKGATNSWIRDSGKFLGFERWQEGYGAFTVGWDEKDRIVEYIKSQEAHHRRVSFLEELRALVEAAGLEWDDVHLP